MVCKYCHKKLPETVEAVCPHCFAEWAAVEDPKKEDKKSTKTVEHNTVNGHE